MKTIDHSFTYESYASAAGLGAADAGLLAEARKITGNAYAPYSRFRVGAAARLQNGIILTGTNQENASFPAGLCAERVLLSAAVSAYPGVPVESIAVSYSSDLQASDHPVTPCGICRQSLQETEQRFHQPIRLILAGQEGPVWVFPRASMLLPLAFTAEELRG